MRTGASEAAWRPLYVTGALCAALAVALLPVAALGFVVAPPAPDAASAFALVARSPLLGLLSFDLVYMIEIVLAGVVLLAVAIALRNESPAFAALATFLNLAATSLYFASNPAFEMLTLASRHAHAATDVDRASFIAAGESMLAQYTGTAYVVSYLMAGSAGLVLAIVMWRSNVFSKSTAGLGIAMGVLALVPPTAGRIGFYAAFAYLAPFSVWAVLVARRLWTLGREAAPRRKASPMRAHLTGWLVLPFVAAFNGGVRDFTYGRAMSTAAAHAVSVLPLVIFILAWAAVLARRRPLPDHAAALRVGTAWLLGTLAFETILGLATGSSLVQIAAQYDVTRGSLWPLVPLATFVAPIVAQRLIRPSTCVDAVVAG